MSRVGKVDQYDSHAVAPTPESATFIFIYRFTGDGLVYGKKSDGTSFPIGSGGSLTKAVLADYPADDTKYTTPLTTDQYLRTLTGFGKVTALNFGTAFVNDAYGDDATGVVGSPLYPFKSCKGAEAAFALSTGNIFVLKGLYSGVDNIGLGSVVGVNYYCEQGAIFSPGVGNIAFSTNNELSITGHASFIGDGVALIAGVGADVIFEFDKIDLNTGVSGQAIQSSAALKLNIKGKSLISDSDTGNGVSCLYIKNTGFFNIDIDLVDSTSNATSDGAIKIETNPAPNSGVINISKLLTGTVSGGVPCIDILSNIGYLELNIGQIDFISGNGTIFNVDALSTGTLIVNSKRIRQEAGFGYSIIQNGNNYFNVDRWEINATLAPIQAIEFQGGVNRLNAEIIQTQDSLCVTNQGGSLTISGRIENKSATPNAHAVGYGFGFGGGLITLKNLVTKLASPAAWAVFVGGVPWVVNVLSHYSTNVNEPGLVTEQVSATIISPLVE